MVGRSVRIMNHSNDVVAIRVSSGKGSNGCAMDASDQRPHTPFKVAAHVRSCATPTNHALKWKRARSRLIHTNERYDTDTYRAVCTVQSSNVIYVLHTFQKKSKSGIATPQKDIELIRRRLAEAQRLNRQRSN